MQDYAILYEYKLYDFTMMTRTRTTTFRCVHMVCTVSNISLIVIHMYLALWDIKSCCFSSLISANLSLRLAVVQTFHRRLTWVALPERPDTAKWLRAQFLGKEPLANGIGCHWTICKLRPHLWKMGSRSFCDIDNLSVTMNCVKFL
jgi:hypothetical protein